MYIRVSPHLHLLQVLRIGSCETVSKHLVSAHHVLLTTVSTKHI